MEDFFLKSPTAVLWPHPQVQGPGNVMVEPHQPPKSLWVNTPHPIVHTSECWHCLKPGAEAQTRGGIQGTDRDVVMEEKETPRLQRDGRLPAPPQGHGLTFPQRFLSSLFATALRKCNMRQLGPFMHAERCTERLNEQGFPSWHYLWQPQVGDHLNVMLGRQRK